MSAPVNIRIQPGWTGTVSTETERRSDIEYERRGTETRRDVDWAWHDAAGDRISGIHTDTTYEYEVEHVPVVVESDVTVGRMAIDFDDGSATDRLRAVYDRADPGDRLYRIRYTCGDDVWTECFNVATGRWVWDDRRSRGAADMARSMLWKVIGAELSGMSGRGTAMKPMAIGGLAVSEAVLRRRGDGTATLAVRGGEASIPTNALLDGMEEGALVIVAMPDGEGEGGPVLAYALDPATLREHVGDDARPDLAASVADGPSATAGASLGLAALTAGLAVMTADGAASYAGVAIAMCGMAASLKAVRDRGEALRRHDIARRAHDGRTEAVRRTRLAMRRWTWRRIREGI